MAGGARAGQALRVGDEGAGLAALAEVVVEGPVSDAVFLDGVLYVAGARLAVFDLADPANPIPQTEIDLFAGSPVEGLVVAGGRLWALGAEGAGQRLLALDRTNELAPIALPAESLLVTSAPASRLLIRDGDLYRLGTARIERFDLALGAPPTLAASGSPAGAAMIDLESAEGALFVASRGQGVRQLFEASGVLTLGAAPSPGSAAAGLFALSEGGGERLWRAAGLAGAAAHDSTRRAPTGCHLRDVEVAVGGSNELLLLTGCGIEREVMP